MKILGDVLESRGGNPFVRLNRVVPPRHGDVFVQLEYLNPSGSIKDRIAAFMIARNQALPRFLLDRAIC